MKEWLSDIKWKGKFAFECCGVKLGMRTDEAALQPTLEKILPSVSRPCSYSDASDVLSLVVNQGIKNGFYFNDELAMEIKEFDDSLLEPLADKILVVLAQISLPEKFYLHAGGVVWNGSGILLPGASFAGKTTLTKEFIKAGADYLSDDCVVLDNRGYLHPFPRDLAIRTDSGERIIRNAEYFGSKTAEKKVRLKLILFTGFKENAEWKPAPISRGKAVLELMNNFYFRPSIGLMPGEIIKSLVAVTSAVDMYEGKRNEAGAVIDWVKNYFSKSFTGDRSKIAKAKTK